MAAGVLWLSLGRLVTAVNPIERADAIYVLGGTRVNRVVEATRLYHEGYAPRIFLSPGNREFAEEALERQGVHVPTNAELGRDLLITRLGVPAPAVVVLEQLVDNTAQEADAIRPRAESEGWRRLIVVTDLPSSRRVGYAFRRVFGTRLQVIVTANRDDPFDPNRWWRARWSVRATFYEAPKLFAYWMGLRG